MFNAKFLSQNPKNKSPNIIHRKSVIRSLAGLLLFGIGSFAQASECNKPDGERPPVPKLTIKTVHGNEEVHNVYTSDIWAIWWGKNNRLVTKDTATNMAKMLNDARCRALLDLKLSDPPDVQNGHYFNVFLHVNGDPEDANYVDDGLPDKWGNGVGRNTTAENEEVRHFVTGAYTDPNNAAHEAFHVFQLSRELLTPQPYPYSGDSAWFIEASATWFAEYTASNQNRIGDKGMFTEIGANEVTPFLSLWHSNSNGAPTDPGGDCDWIYGVHQYGMSTFLYYLTSVHNVDPDVIAAGFSQIPPVTITPQEYIAEELGREKFSKLYGDWAAANADDYSYLTGEQVNAGREMYKSWRKTIQDGDPNMRKECLAYRNPQPELVSGLTKYTPSHISNGLPVAASAKEETLPRSYGYNVIRLDKIIPGNYTVKVTGKPNGVNGADSVLQARVVVKEYGKDTSSTVALNMTNRYTGTTDVIVKAKDERIFLVVAATPDVYTGFDQFNYDYAILPKGLDWSPELAKNSKDTKLGRAKVGAIFKRQKSGSSETEYFRLAETGPSGEAYKLPRESKDNAHYEYLGTNWNRFDQKVVAWGDNDREGTIGDVFIYANPFSKKVEYYKLKNLGSDKRYWYFPTGKDGVRDNYYWTYLGNDYPNQ